MVLVFLLEKKKILRSIIKKQNHLGSYHSEIEADDILVCTFRKALYFFTELGHTFIFCKSLCFSLLNGEHPVMLQMQNCIICNYLIYVHTGSHLC